MRSVGKSQFLLADADEPLAGDQDGFARASALAPRLLIRPAAEPSTGHPTGKMPIGIDRTGQDRFNTAKSNDSGDVSTGGGHVEAFATHKISGSVD